jgi:hypothetical protein
LSSTFIGAPPVSVRNTALATLTYGLEYTPVALPIQAGRCVTAGLLAGIMTAGAMEQQRRKVQQGENGNANLIHFQQSVANTERDSVD